MKKITLIPTLLLGIFFQAQVVEGVVIDEENKEPIQNVRVSPQYSNIWVLTDENGKFSIDTKGNKNVVFKISGYKEALYPAEKVKNVLLTPISIRIKEVVITAEKKSFSEIEIKEEALKNVQAFSVADVLSQLPGQYIQKDNHNSFKNIVFRTASQVGINSAGTTTDYGNKAFGTAIMLNDIALSNNENMQNYLPQYNGAFDLNLNAFRLSHSVGTLSGSQPNFGFDLREIVVGNIENIIVNQGIPDAKYGDLTSGLIRIETQAGKNPYRLSASLNGGTYQLNLTKGIQLNNRGNALNFKVNYMNSNPNPRNSLVESKRLAVGLLWGIYSKDKKLYNKLALDFNKTFDEGKTSPDAKDAIYVKNDKQGFRISNNLKYRFAKNSWLDNFNANIGFSYDKQISIRRNFVNSGARPYGTALENSTYYSEYTPPTYFNTRTVEGIPINLFTDFDFSKRIKTQTNWIHDLSIGANFRYGDNIGRGRYGNTTFSFISAGSSFNGYRDFNFQNNVPADVQTAFYIQDNIMKRFAQDWLFRLNAGLRFDIQNNNKNYAPRINTSISYRNLNFRAGVGLTSKSPSLNQLYTGERYLDYLIGDYRLPGHYNVAIMQTFVTPGNNTDLKPSKSFRSEAGVDYKLPFVTVVFTGFYNELKDGFTAIPTLKKGELPDVAVQFNGNNSPTYTIVGTKDFFYIQNHLTNAYNSIDKGLELGLNFKNIESLNLGINIQGSYVKTNNDNKVETLTVAKSQNEFVYGVYAPRNTAGERLQLNSRFSYHIPKAGLIIGLGIENFIIDSSFVEENSRYPIGYIDRNMNKIYIPENERTDIKYSDLFLTASASSSVKLKKLLTNAHLRITKDFLNGFQSSIYVNNFLNLKPLKEDLDEARVVVYSNFAPISFGADIRYQF